jgi:ABC-type cobalamin/Fe3+-siderophores transport system ATPase subunit
MNVLDMHDIHRSFEAGVPVLDGVDLTMAPGEVVGLLGRNGSGKTTLIHIAIGMLHQQQGTVKIFGLDPHTRPLVAPVDFGPVVPVCNFLGWCVSISRLGHQHNRVSEGEDHEPVRR